MAENFENNGSNQTSGNSGPEDKGTEEKLYTKDEVSRIVQERLAQARRRADSPSDKENELAAREARLSCKEHLLDVGAPMEYLDVLDTSDPEKFKAAVEKLSAISGQQKKPRASSFPIGGGRPVGMVGESEIANAFKPRKRG